MTGSVALVVVGVGGAGVNAVNHLAEFPVPGARYVAVDTSAQSLAATAHHGDGVARLLLRAGTRGLGTGGNAQLGAHAAAAASEAIGRALSGAPIVAVVAGLAGGTGAGGGPVVAAAARERGALTLGFGVTPFPFEAPPALACARRARGDLAAICHAMVALDNARALSALGRAAAIDVALRAADETVRQAIEALVALAGTAWRPGAGRRWLDCDLARIRSLLEGGEARLGVGYAVGGEAPVQRALHQAVAASDGPCAAGVLVHVTGGEDLAIADVAQAAEAAERAWAPGGAVDVGVTALAGWRGVARVLVLGTRLRQAIPVALPAGPAATLQWAV